MTPNTPLIEQKSFSNLLLDWFDLHGRKTLPWQDPITHYRVWISEIMLQQTQVATVIDYFNRFIARFPTIESLALAPLDELMNAWAGLGYYSRARNIHKTAQIIVHELQGEFPNTLEGMIQLPGIGRSTASAILSIVNQQPLAILDGNVKRVLTRYYQIPGWYGESKVQKQLWQLAERLVPEQRAHHYTQAIMDLGAMICTPKNPNCLNCPMKPECQAYQHQTTQLFPSKKPVKKQPERSAEFAIIIINDSEILLQKQTQKGVWNELWVPPNTLFGEELWTSLIHNNLSLKYVPEILKPFTHVFTHFKLKISAKLFLIPHHRDLLDFSLETVKLSQLSQYGLPAPIQKLLGEIFNTRNLFHEPDDFLHQTPTRVTWT